MASYPPFKPGSTFNTKLDPLNEMAFRQWAQTNNVPFDANAPVSDYDMRGYYQGLQNGNPMARPTEINPNDNRPHFTDYYKTPLHQSFSADSQWAGPNAPNWINGQQLVAPNGRVVFDETPVSDEAKALAVQLLLPPKSNSDEAKALAAQLLLPPNSNSQ